MRTITTFVFAFLLSAGALAQGQVFSGWIRADLLVEPGKEEKVKQQGHSTATDGEKANVWLSSSEGWIKLHFSVQRPQGKKAEAMVFEEQVPIFEADKPLWESNKLHSLEAPGYTFQFKVFSIGPSKVEGKNTRVSLYYRWVLNDIAQEDQR